MASFLILLGIALIVLGLAGLALPAVPDHTLKEQGVTPPQVQIVWLSMPVSGKSWGTNLPPEAQDFPGGCPTIEARVEGDHPCHLHALS